MPKLDAKSVKIFANDAGVTWRFGDFTPATRESKDPDELQTALFNTEGWSDTTTQPNRTPTIQHFNTLSYLHSRELAYLKQAGIPEYVADTTYYMESIVRKEGTYELYGSLIDDNTGNALPDRVDDANWKYIIDLQGTGGLKELDVNDRVYYGGDESKYEAINDPVYDEANGSYLLNGTSQFFSTTKSVGGADEFVIETRFNTNTLGTFRTLFGSDQDGVIGIQIDIRDTNFLALWASSDGSTTDISAGTLGTTPILADTDYYVRLTKTLTDYIVDLSTDGVNYTQEIIVSDSRPTFEGSKLIFAARTPTTNWFAGNFYLSDTRVTKDGVEILSNQLPSEAFIINSIVWKGKARSKDNSVDIVTSDYIRSNELRNQFYEFVDDGRLPPYDAETLSVEMNGTERVLFIDSPDITTSDFDIRNRVEFTATTNEPVFSIGGAAPSNSMVLKVISGVANLFMSSTGSGWDISNGLTGSKVYTANIIYDFRLAKTPTGYVLQYSEDLGQTWIDDITVTSGSVLFQAGNTIWGGDYSPNPDIWMEGTMYLEGISLFTNGQYAMAPQDPKTATIPDRVYYVFAGFDVGSNLILERCYEEDGSDLQDIVGAKRRVYKCRYDAEGDIIPFKWYYEKGGRAKILYKPNLYQPRDLTSTFTRKIFTAPPNTEAISQVAINNSGGSNVVRVSYDGVNNAFDLGTGISSLFILYNTTFQLDELSGVYLAITNNTSNSTEVREVGFYDERND